MAAQTGNAAPVLSDFQGQGAVYDGLMRTLHDGTFVHAYLITGLEGMGKRTLARLLAQYWLCQAPEGEKRPCGVCRACQQVRDGTHADLVIIAPGKPINPDVRPDMKSIPVDEIRALIAITARHTFEGGRRVVLIEQADKMNPPAQNALLKTLEEPVPGTIFLLMTESPSLLLPTIVSRCRELKLHPWDDRTVLSVLEKHGVTGQRAQEALHVSGGSIGKALAVAGDEQYWQRRSEVMRDFFALERRSDILRISSTWKDRKDDAEELLDDVEDMLRTLLLCHLGQRSESAVTPYPAAWQRFSREGELSAMMRLLDAVAQARQMRANQVTWQAVVERLLLSLMEEKANGQRNWRSIRERREAVFFTPGALWPTPGDFVIVETTRGIEFGEVVTEVREIDDTKLTSPLKQVVRIATEEDILHDKENKAAEKEAFTICQKKIADHKLDMKLVSVEYTFDNKTILFYFTANGRVDFRSLVKDLAGVFKTRIELRQIGVRDEAKMLGGLGPCGRPICCGTFLGDFQPVSIKMAKEQNLSLNPIKISGVCGRLMCCLKYEQDTYEEIRKSMPKEGKEVMTPDGVGVVCELKIITESVKVRIKKGDSFEIKEYPATDVQRLTPQNAPRPEAQRAEKPEQKQDTPEAAEIKECPACPERPPRAERPMRPEKPMKVEKQPEAPKPEKPAEAPKPAVSPWKMAVEQALRAAQNSADTADEVIEQPVQEAPVSEETIAMPEAAPAAACEAVETVVEEFAAGAETPLSASTEAVEEAVEDAMEMPLIPLDEDDDTI